MAEYIQRSYIRKMAMFEMAYTMETETDAAVVLRMIDDAPAADVAPVVHGRWIPSESDFDDDDTLFDVEEWCDWQCSACREDICYEDPMPPRLLPKYCPNCGAKMDGGNS